MTSRMVSSLQSIEKSDAISYLSQKEAAEVDEILMGPLGFSVDQLMASEFLSFGLANMIIKAFPNDYVLCICRNWLV